MAQSSMDNKVHSEMMAWSNITGVRLDGELIDFESSLCVGIPGGKIEKTGRERQQDVRYRREGETQIVDIPLHGAHFHQEVTDMDERQVRINLNVEADETLREGAFFSMAFAPKYYANAKIRTSGKKVTVELGPSFSARWYSFPLRVNLPSLMRLPKRPIRVER